MARLSKRRLLGLVETAVRDSGWSLLHLRGPKHPARYRVYQNGRGYSVRVYIWNVTPGGTNRPIDEYRIQATGIGDPTGTPRFVPEIGGKTLILGWWDQAEVFAGFDYSYHTGPLGKSDSLQINEATLYAAHANGFAVYNKGNGELAIAFRPDFIGSYIENLESLHECGESPKQVRILDEIADNPEGVEDSEIETEVPGDRQYAIISTKRALRDLNFRDRVLTAYGHCCGMCGVQLKLLDAAHILPVIHPDSTDATSNGVALCALHHRAYDRAFVTFDERYRLHSNARMAAEFKANGHDGGLSAFNKALRSVLILPPDKRDRPRPKFVRIANDLRGW